MEVPYYKASLGEEEIDAVARVITSGWLTTGKVTAEFESKFADCCGARFALATNSCTAALHLALEAIGIGPGDRVVVPSLTFTATAEVIRYMGADPLFIDVDPHTCLMTGEALSVAISRESNIKACIAVNFAGQSADMDGANGIWALCQQHDIKLVIDAAHAFPAADTYGPVGSIGDVTCFSFYANKTITTGEGGMLVTDDEQIASRVKVMRLHGIDRDVWDRFTSDKPAWEYDVIDAGFKYNLPDINAAIGIAQLEKAERMRQLRQEVAQRYRDVLQKVSGISLLRSRVEPEQHAWHLFPVVLRGELAQRRNEIIQRLAENGIATSVHYKPLHRMTYYRNRYRLSAEDFPHTERYWQGCFSLPIYAGLSAERIDYVLEKLARLLE